MVSTKVARMASVNAAPADNVKMAITVLPTTIVASAFASTIPTHAVKASAAFPATPLILAMIPAIAVVMGDARVARYAKMTNVDAARIPGVRRMKSAHKANVVVARGPDVMQPLRVRRASVPVTAICSVPWARRALKSKQISGIADAARVVRSALPARFALLGNAVTVPVMPIAPNRRPAHSVSMGAVRNAAPIM